jgi:hypothetical protein
VAHSKTIQGGRNVYTTDKGKRSFFKREDSVVETASRFARDLMVQEVGFTKLQALGIKLCLAMNALNGRTNLSLLSPSIF